MEVLQESTGKGTATIEVIISKQDLNPKVEKALKTYQRRASMPGFRPGKVPMGMVKKMYGSAVMAEELNNLVSESLNNYIFENKINLLGYPLPDTERSGQIDLESDEDLHFFFDIGLAPEIDVDLAQFTETYHLVKADDAEIQKVVDRMLDENPDTIHPETIEAGDMIDLRIVQADAEGNEVAEGLDKFVKLELKDAGEEAEKFFVGKPSGDEFVLNFEQLLGAEKAEQLLNLEEEQKDLLTSDFNVIIDDISREVPAELNPDFFNRMFPYSSIETEEEFRARIAEELERQLNQQSEMLFFNTVFDRLINETQIELPEEFLKKWLIDRNQGAMTEEQAVEDLEKHKKSIHFQLIEESLKLKYPNTIEVSNEEIRNFVKAYFFQQFGGQTDISKELDESLNGIVDNILKDENEVMRVERQLAEQKMIKLFNEKVTKVEETVTPDGLKEIIENYNKTQEEAQDE